MEKKLSDLLARLPIPGLKESNQRHTIAEKLTALLKISIKPNQVQLKDSILTVSVPPVVKSALRIKQKEIVEILNREGIEIKELR